MEERKTALTAPALSIGTRMARGAAWMVVLQSADRVLGFISMLVLARLLVPADFGLVALGMAIVASLAVFSEFGFDLALIQNQSAEPKHYDTAWTLGLLRGFLLGGLLLLLSDPAAAIFGDERLAGLIAAMAVFPLLEGFANIGVVEFRKQLIFGKEFLYRFSGRLGGVITAITLAVLWQDYWALVAGQFVNRGLRLALSYGLHPYRPRLSLAAWRDLFHFSKWLLLNGIFNFASRRAATFVVGVFMTPASVGIFTLGAEITGLVSQAFVAPIKRTYFPGFAKLSHDLTALREVFLKAYGLVILLAVPATVGIGMTADLFVPPAFGENWLETIPIIGILVYAALTIALQGPVRPILLALNRPEIVTYLSMINTALFLPSLIGGAWVAGLAGAAWATVGTRLIMMVLEYYILHRFIQVSFISLLGRFWRPLASCGLLILSVWALKQYLVVPGEAGLGKQLLNLVLVISGGVVAYGAGLLLLWVLSRRPAESAEGIVLSVLRNKLSRKDKALGGKITSGGKAGP